MENPLHTLHEKMDGKLKELKEYIILRAKIEGLQLAISADCAILNDLDPEHAAEYDAIRAAVKAIK